ncbi:hypothetical protein PC129_g23001 [Phytophthora cactorum]|uniref:Uncharacterized protein n=1 Tax=Phytophthora cactorum TaxID=29920 RepID=A0A8T1FIE9_9STRA|nr:hypothetical protein PC111_g21664 [Phytophthora cactorum]KAG2797600.1 hypothetical protein PC112_g21709 [Phytophthora cactorum]KAG2851954.1 hypothetical protein PC113_g15450 [Phytophthora cactorum]KAG2876710.1 hypothetical protein PC114_g24059 [Phytophthora cactorum]KAG2878788.1 hypothetical protein PC115_g22974 [Phytophthora cactorum]
MAFFNQVTKAALALLTLPFLTAQAIFSTCEITDSDACGIDSLTASIDHGSVLIKVVMTRAAPSTSTRTP